jgi:hypothetical protein
MFVSAKQIVSGTYTIGSSNSLSRSPPQLFRDTVTAHHLYDVNRFSVLQGIREMVSWVGLTALVLLGFLTAPFAASLTAEPPVPARILFITPFAAIVAACGVRWLTPRVE